MGTFDYVLEYRRRDGSWESVDTPKGALDNVTPAQAQAYLGQWHASHLDLLAKVVCLGDSLKTGES